MQMWKTTGTKSFGNGQLIEFLEQHGAVIESKLFMFVPALAIRAALNDPDEAGLTEEDITFLKAELEQVYYDEDMVDSYDLC
jgi:hypothetical protein